MKQYTTSIFIFRRDLRLQDNTGLLAALDASDTVIPIFVFDDRQIDEKKNAYYSHPAVSFMKQSLRELHDELKNKRSKLYCFSGTPELALTKIDEQIAVDAVFINRDYTPFSQTRDEQILQWCDEADVTLSVHDDYLLQPPEATHKDDGKPYTVFTPFFKRCSTIPVLSPKRNTHTNYYAKPLTGADLELLNDPHDTSDQLMKGGRTEAAAILRSIDQLHDYKQTRDIPSVHGTSRLSAHHKFGTISIRETYHKGVGVLGKDSQFITELYWRDFGTYIPFHFPHVFSGAFHKEYDQLQWSSSKAAFKKWCEGNTGFPIVDAAMRELNTTGYMHNRARMIVASFLVKDLQINWQWGEKYFASKLTDYDPCVNNTSWQWASSTGCDAQPYFRIFNPWLQQKKFDPECIYIKTWVPELADIEPKDIHRFFDKPELIPDMYIEPMVNHKAAREKTLAMFTAVRDKKKQ